MSGPAWTSRLHGGVDGIAGLLESCRQVAAGHGVPGDDQRDLVVALEELVTNALRYGAAGGRVPDIDVSLDIQDGVFVLVVTDDGPAFDPLGVAPPARDRPLEDRPIGGLGIHLVRHLMDEVVYARVDERNRVELRKQFAPV